MWVGDWLILLPVAQRTNALTLLNHSLQRRDYPLNNCTVGMQYSSTVQDAYCHKKTGHKAGPGWISYLIGMGGFYPNFQYNDSGISYFPVNLSLCLS